MHVLRVPQFDKISSKLKIHGALTPPHPPVTDIYLNLCCEYQCTHCILILRVVFFMPVVAH